MTFHTRQTKRATGASGEKYISPRVAVCFPQALFERIAGEAERRQIPFAEVVREKMTLAYREYGQTAAVVDTKDRAQSAPGLL